MHTVYHPEETEPRLAFVIFFLLLNSVLPVFRVAQAGAPCVSLSSLGNPSSSIAALSLTSLKLEA